MQKRTVNILHLDGRRLHVECDPSKTRIDQLLQVTHLLMEYLKSQKKIKNNNNKFWMMMYPLFSNLRW